MIALVHSHVAEARGGLDSRAETHGSTAANFESSGARAAHRWLMAALKAACSSALQARPSRARFCSSTCNGQHYLLHTQQACTLSCCAPSPNARRPPRMLGTLRRHPTRCTGACMAAAAGNARPREAPLACQRVSRIA